MKPEYIFVYGTLQTAANNAMSRFLMQYSKIIGKGFMFGKLYKISWFPGAVRSETDDKVYGTVFKLNPEHDVFKTLDDYEGFYKNDITASLFIRELTEVFLEDGDRLSAWVYLYNQNIVDAPQIISGDFLKDAKT